MNIYNKKLIFVIGPAFNNLKTLKETIAKNSSHGLNILHTFVITNDKTVETYFEDNPTIAGKPVGCLLLVWR